MDTLLQRDPDWGERNNPTSKAPFRAMERLQHWLVGLDWGFQDPGEPLSPVGGNQFIWGEVIQTDWSSEEAQRPIVNISIDPCS